MMEKWNTGIMGTKEKKKADFTLFHYSNIPIFLF